MQGFWSCTLNDANGARNAVYGQEERGGPDEPRAEPLKRILDGDNIVLICFAK